MYLGHRVVASLLGVIAALCGLAIELVALPLARFGESLFTYIADNAPHYEGQLTGSVIAWIVAAAIPVLLALLVNLKSSSREGSRWVWALFGFGLPASVSFGVAFVAGGVTYSMGIVPDYATETPWPQLALVVVYVGALALIVSGGLAVAMAAGRRSAA